MVVAVGSLNPVKIAAVRFIVTRVWPAASVRGIRVDSGVRAMPVDDAECIAGARARARAALDLLDADLAMGLEGGVHTMDDQVYLVGWVAAVDRTGQEGIGSAARMALPPAVCEAIGSGRELGPLMDQLSGRERTNEAEGAIGILTQGLTTRQESFQAGAAFALAPWLNPKWYGFKELRPADSRPDAPASSCAGAERVPEDRD
jgi:inosine/xanthosine triphosphatase